jgi:hypothetical protein
MIDLVTSSTVCLTGDVVNVTFDLTYQGNGGDNFNVYDNLGNIFLFQYADLPVTVSLSASSVPQNLGFQVCDEILPNCCLFHEFPNPCYQPPICSITNITTIPTCQAGTNDFNLTLDFEHEYSSNNFIVMINDINYGTYNYTNLPINIGGLAGDCITEYTITIQDSNDPNCIATDFLTPQCCNNGDCTMEIIETALECIDVDTLSVTFDLTYSNTGNTGFVLTDESGQYTTYTYAQLPVTTFLVAPPSDPLISMTICDIDNPNCCHTVQIENPCYQPTCLISNMTLLTTCNNDDLALFTATIDADYTATMDSFILSINNIPSGIYGYAQLPISIDNLSADCETPYDFTITDITQPTCTSNTTSDPICCTPEPCEIGIASVSDIVCIGGDTVTFVLDLTTSGTDTVGFTIYDFVGNLTFYTYDQLPVTVIITGPADATTISFSVCDFSTPNCCIVYNMDNPCYVSPTCDIDITNLSGIACANSDIATVTFALDTIHVGQTGFVMTDDYGNTETFTYNQLPLVTTQIIAPVNEEVIGFQICDIDNPNCCDYIEFLNPCFVPSTTSNRVISTAIQYDYTGQTFSMILDINHTLKPECVFEVNVNGNLMAEIHALDSIAVLGPIQCYSEEQYHVLIYSKCDRSIAWDTVITAANVGCISGVDNNTGDQQIFLGYDSNTKTVNIINKANHNLKANIIDIYGRVIYTNYTSDNTWTNKLDHMYPGIYILQAIDTNTKQIHSLKMLITH